MGTTLQEKIEEQIELISALPETAPFSGFVSMEGGPSQITHAEEARAYTRKEVEAWQTQRDKMEEEAGAFQAEDMTKMRSLATSESPPGWKEAWR